MGIGLIELGVMILPLLGIANLICLILVLIKLFPAEGPVKGVLGIICGIYTFIWGWQNVDRFNLRQIMKIWTVVFIGYIVAYVIVMATVGLGARM